MNRSLIASFLLTAGSLATLALAPADRIVFTQAGFSIDVLDSAPGNESTLPLMMMMPASDGFTPNVNVVIQQYPEGLDAYRKLTLTQLSALGMELIQEREISATTLLFEYIGNKDDRVLHHYSRAIHRDGRIYLATGTSLAKQWEAVGPALRACVDSLELPRINLKEEDKPSPGSNLTPTKLGK